MRSHRDEVFVIKSINYSEADKILTVFGKERGKFSILAKGVRRITSRNRGNIQTFSISKISYYQATGLPVLMETEQISTVDYEEIDSKNAQKVLFLLNKFLAEDTPSEKIFKALVSIVRKDISDEYVNKFRVIFLQEEGLIHIDDECSSCGKKDKEMYIRCSDFALFCSNCYSNKDSNYLAINKNIYSERLFTKMLDDYVQKIYFEMT